LLSVENLPRPARIVAAELAHGILESGGSNRLEQAHAFFRLEKRAEKDEIVLLLADAKKIQIECVRRRAHAEAGICEAAGDGDADGHVRELVALVAADAGGVDLQTLQFIIEQDARARAGLTVDEHHVATR